MAINLDIDIDAILTAVAWPVFAGIVLILVFRYRHRIAPFIKDVKLSKFSFGATGVSMELAEAKGFEPDMTGPSEVIDFDLRHELGTIVSESEMTTIWELIAQEDSKDYAVFNLGSGKTWLSSRLFLFTVVLHHLYNLKRMVFLSSKNGVSNRFIGLAEPEQVRDALSKEYGWFESALGKAYLKWLGKDLDESLSRTPFGSITRGNARFVVERFLEAVQLSKEKWEELKLNSQLKQIPPINENHWMHLKNEKEGEEKWEHSDWMNSNKLEDILGNALDKSSWITESELQTKSREDQVLAVLSQRGRYVVLLDELRRFENGRVIDRVGLALESVRHLLANAR